MQYIKDRSFIASFVSTTQGYEGYLDSIEGTPRERRRQWLTVSPHIELENPQHFWFGYFEGAQNGYQVRTVEFNDGESHFDIWDISSTNAVGYYAKSAKPVSWRVRVAGAKIGVPEIGIYTNVTLAAPSQAMLSVATRPPWDEHFVGINRPNLLVFEMNVKEIGVDNFTSFSQHRRR